MIRLLLCVFVVAAVCPTFGDCYTTHKGRKHHYCRSTYCLYEPYEELGACEILACVEAQRLDPRCDSQTSVLARLETIFRKACQSEMRHPAASDGAKATTEASVKDALY